MAEAAPGTAPAPQAPTPTTEPGDPGGTGIPGVGQPGTQPATNLDVAGEPVTGPAPPTSPPAEAAPPDPLVAPPPAEQPAQPEQPARPPDLGDAVQQMNQNLTELRERIIGDQGQGQQEDVDLLADLFDPDEPEQPADPAYPQYGQPQQQPQFGQQPQPQQQDPQQQHAAAMQQQLNEYIQSRVEAALEPEMANLQMREDRREVVALMDKYPRMRDPQIAKAVGQNLKALAERYGNEAMRTDPMVVEQQYLAYEARLAGVQAPAPAPQPSPGAEVPGAPIPAEAGGQPQQAAPMETGAGPGVPQAPEDPVALAYYNALSGGNVPPPRDIIS